MQSVEDQLEAVVASGIPGAVAVAFGPDARIEAASGFADLRTGEALTVDHRFRIGSVTKIFVAALVLQLVAEGLLDLDGDAAPFAEDITIRQLLNHTSGLQDWVGESVEFFEPYRRDPGHRFELTPRQQLQLVLEKPREFAPGEGWAYHGSNYLVLRLVVEKTTGMTLRDALTERVLEPLSLERTDFVEGPLRGDCARGYLRRTTRYCLESRDQWTSRRSTSPSTKPEAGSSRHPRRSPGCFAPSFAASSSATAFEPRCFGPLSLTGKKRTATGSVSARSRH
jgi:D-alanyl-D-alanine carboxypeptidase